MNPVPDFTTCRQRIDRAEAQVKVIDDYLRQFRKDHPIRTIPQDKGDGQVEFVTYTSFDDLPIDLSLLLGEALYQIRAALNNTVHICGVQDRGATLTADQEHALEFPIVERPKNFRRKIRQMGLCKERWEIMYAIQPYPAEPCPVECELRSYRRAFKLLNAWSGMDRHKRLQFIAQTIRLESQKIETPDGFTVREFALEAPVVLKDKSNVELARAEIAGPLGGSTIKYNTKIEVAITIGEIHPPITVSDNLTHRMGVIIEAARAVIDALEASYQ